MTPLDRVPEPTLMSDPDRVAAYAAYRYGGGDRAFLAWLMMSGLDLRGATAVDLGCGPGAVTAQICAAFEGLRVTGVDPSAAMVDVARGVAAEAGLESRVDIVRAAIPWAPLHAGAFDAVFSLGLLHHLADPRQLWQEAARLLAPGGHLLVMDLLRPASEAELERAAVEAADVDEVLRADYRASLRAAYSLDEVERQLADSRFTHLSPTAVGDRLFVVHGQLPG